jgi:hypothetical protein
MVGCYGPLTASQLADLLATGNYTLIGGPYPDEATCSASCGVPSGSGSGGSGSGVIEGCPCDPLPMTLMLTFFGSEILNYVPLTGDWVGTFPLGGTAIFSCLRDTNIIKIVGSPMSDGTYAFVTYACDSSIMVTGSVVPSPSGPLAVEISW